VRKPRRVGVGVGVGVGVDAGEEDLLEESWDMPSCMCVLSRLEMGRVVYVGITGITGIAQARCSGRCRECRKA
jgi:hypothetical protein